MKSHRTKSFMCCTVLLALTLTCLSSLSIQATEKEDNNLPNILLIGDSISGGYLKTVEELLKDKANVTRIQGNGRHTEHSLQNLDKYLGDKKWSVIHFNWGLWDMRHEVKKDGKITYAVPIDKYADNLRTLIIQKKDMPFWAKQ